MSLHGFLQVKDPDIGRDIVALGFVRDLEIGEEERGGRNVKFCLRLTTPACPFKRQIQDEAKSLVKCLPWVKEVRMKVFDSGKALHPMLVHRKDALRRTSC